MYAGVESANESADRWSAEQLECSWLGSAQYEPVRELQRMLVGNLLHDAQAPEQILFCEHEPVLTLGNRLSDGEGRELSRATGLPVVKTRRGGQAMYHGPGQLVMYPVINLRRRGLGVRAFVSAGLEAMAELSRSIGVPAEARLEPPGLWLKGTPHKLGFAGVRIRRGITDHGFALNISCNLDTFTRFTCCGLPEAKITSLAVCSSKAQEFSLKSVAKQLSFVFSKQIANRPSTVPLGD